MEITRNGLDTTVGSSDWFTGSVYIDSVAAPTAGSRVSASSVHFTPGARTRWHTHPHGQTIWVTEGVCLCQSRGGMVDVMRAGDRAFFEPARSTGTAPRQTGSQRTSQLAEVDDQGNVATWATRSPTTSTPQPRPSSRASRDGDSRPSGRRVRSCRSDRRGRRWSRPGRGSGARRREAGVAVARAHGRAGRGSPRSPSRAGRGCRPPCRSSWAPRARRSPARRPARRAASRTPGRVRRVRPAAAPLVDQQLPQRAEVGGVRAGVRRHEHRPLVCSFDRQQRDRLAGDVGVGGHAGGAMP